MSLKRIILFLAATPLVVFGALGSCGSSSSQDTSGRGFHSPNESADYNSHLAPGAAAHDLLSADKYQNLIIEIQAMSGYEPTTQAQNALVAFVTARVNKPGGIMVVNDPSIPPQNKGSYSLDDIGQIEANNRVHFSTGTTMASYFLFVDGASSNDMPNSGSTILAYAYQNTSMGVFEKSIRDVSGSLPGQVSTATVESTVVEHEFGHILGLVNLNPGTPMQTPHQDTAHGNHCSVSNCLMYWSVNTSDVVSNLLTLGGTTPQLDAQCLADLKANGGK